MAINSAYGRYAAAPQRQINCRLCGSSRLLLLPPLAYVHDVVRHSARRRCRSTLSEIGLVTCRRSRWTNGPQSGDDIMILSRRQLWYYVTRADDNVESSISVFYDVMRIIVTMLRRL